MVVVVVEAAAGVGRRVLVRVRRAHSPLGGGPRQPREAASSVRVVAGLRRGHRRGQRPVVSERQPLVAPEEEEQEQEGVVGV